VSSAVIRLAAATLMVWLALTSERPRADQDWHALAVASFDEAWQTINDSYFDPTFGGVNWRQVRADLAPKIASAETPDQARAVIRDMLARLGQSHFALLAASATEPPPGPASVPVDVRLFRDEVIVTGVERDSTAWRAGMRPGDVLVAVDGVSTRAMVGALGDRTALLTAWRRVVHALHGPERSVARIDIATSRPDGNTRVTTLSVPRLRESGELVAVGNLPPMLVRSQVRAMKTPASRSVGVIGFNVWMTAVTAPFAAAIDAYRSSDGLVIDLRGNPGGLAEMIRGLSGHLLDEPALLGRMRMRGVELEFRANPRRSTDDGRRVVPFSGPVAILVDELTGSASECFAGALQSLGRARVFGATTMGQALPAVTRRLSNGDVLLYAIGDFVTSTGQRLEGRGVIPDEAVPMSLQALAAGHDAALDAALLWIDRARSRGAQ